MVTRPATDLLRELYRLIDGLSAARGLEVVLDEVLMAAMTLTGSEMGTISPYQSSSQSYGKAVYKGFPTDYVEHMAGKTGPVKDDPRERAFKTGRRVSIPDVYEDPAFLPNLHWVRRAGFVSMQATPIFNRYGEPVGTICTFQCDNHSPSDDQLDLLDLYGKLAGDAIDRENAESTLKESEESFRRLYGLMVRLSSTTSMEEALSEVLSAALELVDGDA
jgi:GAF domain-containing protein